MEDFQTGEEVDKCIVFLSMQNWTETVNNLTKRAELLLRQNFGSD